MGEDDDKRFSEAFHLAAAGDIAALKARVAQAEALARARVRQLSEAARKAVENDNV